MQEQQGALRGKYIAITGATGYVGQFVVPALLRGGAAVRALSRSASRREGTDACIEWVTGDLSDATALHKLVDGADGVVHLAYQHVPGRYRGGEGDDLAQWLEVNLHGTLDLLLAARSASVPQFVFLSSRAVFSRTEPGRVLDETHPTSPDTHYGAYKAAVEAMLHSFAAVEGMRTTALRATGVYGAVEPTTQSKWYDLVKAVLAGEAVTSSRGGTEVHGGDVARTVVALLAEPSRAPAVVHLSDLYVTQRDLVALIREVAGQPGPLPPPSEPPRNVLVCAELAELGIVLGGEALLRRTVEELVAACSARA